MIFFIYFRVLSQSEEHQGIMWALVFFLLEHAGDTTPDTEAPAVLELVLSLVMSPNISISLHQTLLQVYFKFHLKTAFSFNSKKLIVPVLF